MEPSESIVLGGGCFWCLEAVYQRIPGVTAVTSGYSGGSRKNPTYEDVCAGRTGHAEVVRIDFDPGQISLQEILETFFNAHDPTTLNRQGADEGSQYRSIILFNGQEQQRAALAAIEKAKKRYSEPIVTEVQPLQEFFEAESYHQNYFNTNSSTGYCRVVIAPKLKKMGLPG